MSEILAGHITVADAIQLSSYSRGYVYILLRDKKIKSTMYRLGRMRMFLIDRQSLLDFMREQGREPIGAKTI